MPEEVRHVGEHVLRRAQPRWPLLPMVSDILRVPSHSGSLDDGGVRRKPSAPNLWTLLGCGRRRAFARAPRERRSWRRATPWSTVGRVGERTWRRGLTGCGDMRAEPSVLHLDLDAFFASVEQRDKPSLRGKPVIVGGIGPRGVVSTASYQAREYGVRSAMRMTEARARCPNAAYLAPRFAVYRQVARAVRRVLRELSPRIEAPSLDEAYVDLAAGAGLDLTVSGVERIARELKARVHAVTGGLTASVGVGTSKLIAKIASDLDKPDGLVVIPPGGERDLLYP